jgi:hypothetical protein
MPCFILNAYGIPVCFGKFFKKPIFLVIDIGYVTTNHREGVKSY